MFGRGLEDDRYVIERFQSMGDGEIRPQCRNGASKKSRGNASPEIVFLSTVQRRAGTICRERTWLLQMGATDPKVIGAAPLETHPHVKEMLLLDGEISMPQGVLRRARRRIGTVRRGPFLPGLPSVRDEFPKLFDAVADRDPEVRKNYERFFACLELMTPGPEKPSQRLISFNLEEYLVQAAPYLRDSVAKPIVEELRRCHLSYQPSYLARLGASGCLR